MKNLILSPKQLSSIALNCEILGHGSSGLIYKLNDETLLKFYYKDYIDCFQIENNTFQLNKLGDISQRIETFKETNRETAESELLQELLAKNTRYQELIRMFKESFDNDTSMDNYLIDEMFKIQDECKSKYK